MRSIFLLVRHFSTAGLALVLFLLPEVTHAVVIDKIAAIVNDSVITQSEVYASQQLNLKLSGLPEQASTLQDRINFHLVLQQLRNQPPVPVTEEEFQKATQPFIESMGGIDQFREFLGSIGMNYSDFETEARNQLSIRRFIADRFRPFVNVTLADAQKYYDEVYVPIFEVLGKQPPTFPESFDEIQIDLVESQVQDRVKDWLGEIRHSANITVKD
jgi:parvulin-like peptidyl-prolyl isomerase